MEPSIYAKYKYLIKNNLLDLSKIFGYLKHSDMSDQSDISNQLIKNINLYPKKPLNS